MTDNIYSPSSDVVSLISTTVRYKQLFLE